MNTRRVIIGQPQSEYVELRHIVDSRFFWYSYNNDIYLLINENIHTQDKNPSWFFVNFRHYLSGEFTPTKFVGQRRDDSIKECMLTGHDVMFTESFKDFMSEVRKVYE